MFVFPTNYLDFYQLTRGLLSRSIVQIRRRTYTPKCSDMSLHLNLDSFEYEDIVPVYNWICFCLYLDTGKQTETAFGTFYVFKLYLMKDVRTQLSVIVAFLFINVKFDTFEFLIIFA